LRVIEKRVRRFASLCVLTGMVPFSHSVLGQAALPPCVLVQPFANTTLSDATQFYDEPQFTVAGVKDPSETGGHGSDTVRRTTEALTKETVGLGVGAAKTTHQERGEAALRAEVERQPRNATWHHALADLEEKQGDSLAAVKEYQRAAELSPSEINLFDWGAELLLHRAYGST
jgi:hypothetical protein